MTVDLRRIRDQRRLSADEALKRLIALQDGSVDGVRDLEAAHYEADGDLEAAHYEADAILLSLLESYPFGKQIIDAFDAIPKWYS